MINCFSCKKELSFDANQPISRSEECPSCYASIRSCKMCAFYDQTAYNECREPTADRIVEKEKSNFCDFYKLGNSNQTQDKKEDALAAANALFKK